MAYVAASSKGLTPVHPSISKLVGLLKSNDDAILVKALKSIFNIARQDRNRKHLMDCGAFAMIIDLCGHESEEVKEQCGRALTSLAEEEAFADLIGEVGGVGLLTKLA
jgi:hypothetical protein